MNQNFENLLSKEAVLQIQSFIKRNVSCNLLQIHDEKAVVGALELYSDKS